MSGVALREAICEGDLGAVQNLVEAEGVSVNYVDVDDGWPVLLWAVKARQPECLAFLLSKGASVHLGDSSGNTALHKAAYLGFDDCVRILLQYGARADAQNLTRQSPADLADIFGRKHIVDLLAAYEHGAPEQMQ
ncbi:hypothetical protein PybrP1_005411 [[Pythium] brassicae (nom. inval.)]|nr:hypothetical protein PybrP1_005411 [[Pythium] brassicae (nom. inval.)]